jgi:glycosyltransferase involved in cell wall biosynthesis
MKVAIDLLAQVPGQTGATAYWRKMLGLLPAVDPAIEYYLFVTPKHAKLYRAEDSTHLRNLHFVPLNYRAEFIPARLYHQESYIPKFCNQNNIEVHLTCNPVPVIRKLNAAEIWMVLSLQYFITPLQSGFFKSMYWLATSRIKAARSTVVLANSNDAARILRDVARIPASKIVTVYQALDHEMFNPGLPDEGFMQSQMPRLGIQRPYILNVSDNRPYKRQLDLIRAFARLVHDGVVPHHRLVIIGADYMGYRNRLRQAAEATGVRERVVFIDHLPIDLLPNIYRAADLFVYPSVLETFGIPPLEAMACGIPVIISNKSAVVEVSGGGAWVIDPDKTEELVMAMEKLLTNLSYRREFVEKGLQWAKRYSWRTHAREVVEILQRVATNKA